MFEIAILFTLGKIDRCILLNNALLIFSTVESKGYLTRVNVDCGKFEICQSDQILIS